MLVAKSDMESQDGVDISSSDEEQKKTTSRREDVKEARGRATEVDFKKPFTPDEIQISAGGDCSQGCRMIRND